MLHQPPPVTSKSANHWHLQAGDGFNSTRGFQTVEHLSSETVSKGVMKMPHCWNGANHNKALVKPLFEIIDSDNASRMDDDDDNVPASWEDIEDSGFPQIKSSATTATGNNDGCCDSTATDWFNVKPGQLEASKWSMTFHNQAITPPVRSTEWVAGKTMSFSAPATSQSEYSGKKKKKQSLSLFRPGRDDEESEPVIDWTKQFRTRYEAFITPFYDSHCHLDFLFRRSGFRGSFAKYRQNFANTFPSNFAGCVAVFCNPKLWAYESRGKIFIFLCQLYMNN